MPTTTALAGHQAGAAGRVADRSAGRFTATCPGCGTTIPAGQVMCSACARR